MIKSIMSAFLLSALIVACSENALTGKNQLTLLPESELQTMATGEYQKFLDSVKVVGNTANKDLQMVRRVGQRITKAVNEYYAEKGMTDQLAGFKWEYNLVDDKTVNAWCIPCRKIFFYTSMIFKHKLQFQELVIQEK